MKEKFKKGLKGILFLLLLLVMTTGFPGKPVRGDEISVSERSAGEIIRFKGSSGKYLQLKKGKFYLKNRKGNPLTGPQYLKIPSVHGLHSGYYMFDDSGKLLQNEGVYFFRKARAGSAVFSGYYYTTSLGRFVRNDYGLCYLSGFQCRGMTFSGYFYLGEYGKLCDISGKEQVRYLQGRSVHGTRFPANYYWFNKFGRLSTNADFHDVKGKANGVRFQGSYYFGAENGGLLQKQGWITVGGKSYYISSRGKKYTNRWVNGYYLLPDGTIARSMKLPDGSYVDSDGKKCSPEGINASGLTNQLQEIIAGYDGTWSVYVKDLNTGTTISINDTPMQPASIIKSFVMASTFERISRGELPYSDQVKSLLTEMITESSNDAYNKLVGMNSPDQSFLSGTEVVNRYLMENGYSSTTCHSTLHPSSSPFMSNGTNRTTVRDCGLLLERIYRGTCVSPAFSQEMLNLLLGQTRRAKIPAGLPAGTKVANKTGETDVLQHDMAIVYGPRTTYILCVFSSTSEYNGIMGIRKITSAVHSYLN